MRKENLFRNKATKSLVAALAVVMAAAMVPANADAASKNLVIAKGDAAKLTTVAGSKLKKGTYKAKNKKVSVNKKGKVTAKKTGTVKVTAVTKKGKKVTTKVKVVGAPTISKKNVRALST